jgi:hypothetical protein
VLATRCRSQPGAPVTHTVAYRIVRLHWEDCGQQEAISIVSNELHDATIVDSNFHLVLSAPLRDMYAEWDELVGCRGERNKVVGEEQAVASWRIGIGMGLSPSAGRDEATGHRNVVEYVVDESIKHDTGQRTSLAKTAVQIERVHEGGRFPTAYSNPDGASMTHLQEEPVAPAGTCRHLPLRSPK